MDSADFDSLVGQLYEMALVPETLPDVLAAVTRWLDGDTCHLVGWNVPSGPPLLSVSVGLEPTVGPAYAARYAAIDPRRSLAAERFQPGELLRCHEHFDARYVSRSEFYQDYLLPIGIHYLMASDLIHDDTRLVQIAFQRYRGHDPFSSGESERLQRLMPHLQRAITLMLRHQDLQQQAQIVSSGLTAGSLAMIAVDGGARLRYCNPAGEALLREGEVMRLRDGRIGLGNGSRKRNPEDLVNAIGETARSGRSLHLLLGHGSHPGWRYSLTLIPIPKPTNIPGLLGDGVLCLVAPLDRRRVATVRQLMELLGLSAAEARLARAMASGETLEEYARESDLRLATAKSQLRSVFVKTACDRQASLVRLIAAIPPVRD